MDVGQERLGWIRAREESYVRTKAGRLTGLREVLAFPAVKGDEVLAVLNFYSHTEDLTTRYAHTMATIGWELGTFFACRRGQLAPPTLTTRELEVVRLASEGHTTLHIVHALSISVSTAKTHLANIHRKLGVRDRSAAVALALRLGVID